MNRCSDCGVQAAEPLQEVDLQLCLLPSEVGTHGLAEAGAFI